MWIKLIKNLERIPFSVPRQLDRILNQLRESESLCNLNPRFKTLTAKEKPHHPFLII